MTETRIDCGDAHVAEFWAQVAHCLATRGDEGEPACDCVLHAALAELFA